MVVVVDAQRTSVRQYIDMYKDIAMNEMKRVGVPAAITLAQGIFESESGNSVLVKKSNNHFGIKCKAEWTGEAVYHDDDAAGECFRKYDSAYHSYQDHSDFLRSRPHYASLFNLDPADYSGWAYGLKKAGYATNPRYPQLIIKIIEENNLNAYTIAVLKELPDFQQRDFEVKTTPGNIISTSINKINKALEPAKFKAKTYNGLKAVYADSGVSLLAIATQYNIPLITLLDHNDLLIDGLLESPTWIYLERKRTDGAQETYTVTGTETLYEISQKFAIQLSYLMAYNGLTENDVLKKGQVLSLKSKVLIKESNKPDEQVESNISTSKTIHFVKAKETLLSIAKEYKVTMADLRTWNQLKTDQLKIGMKLIVSN
jgi:hypothetical protein